MTENKITSTFSEKLKTLIETCDGVYWNSYKSGFIIADFSKLEETLLQTWEHHLRTFLKKLHAYGFKRRQIFEGVQYTHPELEVNNPSYYSNESNIKLEEISMEDKLKEQQFIIAKIHTLTQFLEQTVGAEENNLNKVNKRTKNLSKIMGQMMFKTLAQTKDINRQQMKKQIHRLKQSIKSTREELQLSFNRLQYNMQEQVEAANMIRDPEPESQVQEKVQPQAESNLNMTTPVKIEELM